MDYAYDPMQHQWTHPETGVTITDEDMPAELVPDSEVRAA